MLRFKRDDGNEYTSWEYKKMSELSQVNQGLQIAIAERSEEPGENKYFYITNEFLKKNSNKKYYIENPPSSVIATVDDILMTRTGNTGIVVSNVEGVFHNNFFKINFDRKKLDKNFLIYYLNHPKTQNKILILAGTSTIPDLNHKDFYSLDVPVPCLEEQQKIADFLSEVDNIIAMSEQEIESLEMQKKGAMQKIFSQEVRFKADDGSEYHEWEEKKIRDILEICHGKDYKSCKQIEKKYPVLGTGGIITYVDEFLCDWECVLIGRKGTIDKPMYMDKPFWSVDTLFFSKPKEKQNVKFQYYLFEDINWKKYNEASGVPSLSASTIENIKVHIPCLEEQQKIADFLSEFDNAIEYAKEELEVWKNIKKGLLQQMFE